MGKSLSIETLAGHPDFRALGDIAGVGVELRYATPDNCVGDDMYSPYDCAWLHRDAARRLENAAELLAARGGGLRLLVLDALRPQRVQERMWAALEGTPLTQYLANPLRGSIHSFGMAVDVTLVGAAGRELDMGTQFDDLSERSPPGLEAALGLRGEPTPAQGGNRELLRAGRNGAAGGGLNSEWWGVDAGDRDLIRAGYLRVL